MVVESFKLSPELLISAYESGYFPMAESRDNTDLLWFNPDPRAIIPLDNFHLSRSLRKLIRQKPYNITVNSAFFAVIHGCAATRAGAQDSWINKEIIANYLILHELNYAHSVECWDDKGNLVGGLYGVSIGGAFFGESMFSHAPNSSKIAFAYLLEILLACNYTLLDTQFVNEHLLQFGVIEISRSHYLSKLRSALIALPNPSHQFLTLAGTIVCAKPTTFSVMRSGDSSNSIL